MDRTGGFAGTVSSRDAVSTIGLTTICLSGEHDAFNADIFSFAMARATAAGDGDVVVDLQDVAFMAVATVRVILEAHVLLRRQSRSVVLRTPSPSAMRVLALCGVVDLFEPNVAAAAAAGP